VDVNVEIDELVLDGDVDPVTLADRFRATDGSVLSPAVAMQVGRAVLEAVSEGGSP
jgi:hypothetical protein